MALLTVSGAAFGYEGHTVVDRLDFAVNAGDYLCIVGENGSGKTTLMNGLLGLKAPLRGTVQTGEGLAAADIGYLPQQTPAQRDFPASVREVVLSGRLGQSRGRLFYSAEDKAAAKQYMQALGIEALAKRSYRTLSGGQQQRVLLARALCAAQKLLLMDEPVSGLDPVVTADLYRLIGQINKEWGTTVIMISHDVEAATQNASHILHLARGQAFYGPCAEYLQTEAAARFVKGGAPHA